MIRSGRITGRAHGSRIGVLLLTLAIFLGVASSSRAEDCSALGGVVDGLAGDIAPSQIQIDTNCTIKNFPASDPLGTNFSFLTQPGQQDERWLIVFDNVFHTGQMACNSVAGHKIWFVNGSSSAIQEGCQNLLIPVEKIDKQNPIGQSTVAVGVPFTYTLTMPVLFDPATGTVINFTGSRNDLHGVTLIDDLNETDVDLTYLSHVAYLRSTGAPVPHTFSNVGGVLTFDDFPIIVSEQQIVVELTVVLDDTPVNAPSTQFINIARWDFGRLIDGVFYQPLPGESGISPPLTIAAPDLVVTKTGPATQGSTLNLGRFGQFGVDVQNIGLGDAWDTTIVDRLPRGASGGMCDLTPEVLSAQVFAADGITPVPGKGPLLPGTDYTLRYDAAPSCELTLTLLTAAGAIGTSERLIVRYQTQLDAGTQHGAMLTNVVGATEWFNGDSSDTTRLSFARELTDGTPDQLDHEDAHTITVALFGYIFEKMVSNLSSGASPATTASPGDTLRYALRLQSTNVPFDDVAISDDLGARNASAVFVPGSLQLVASTIPAGASTTLTNPNGGTNGDGSIDIRNLSLPVNGEIRIEFDITVAPGLPDGTVIENQAELIGTEKLADSDDPNVNGQADSEVDGDEDPTRIVVAKPPAGALRKQNTQTTASVGEPFRYRITVPENPYAFPMYDVRIVDDLTASAADMRFVDVAKIAGSGPWTPSNTGDATHLTIEDPAVGIDIPVGEQIVIEITVVLADTATNVAGLTYTNTASYTYNTNDGDENTGGPGTSDPMTIIGPELMTMEKSGPATMTIGLPGTFSLDVHNASAGSAWNLQITDRLPNTATGGTCDAEPTAVTARVFDANATTPISGPLVDGTDFDVRFVGAPDCELTLTMLSSQATVGAGQRLIVTYQAGLDAGSQDGALLTNMAGATEWFGAEASSPDIERRVYTETLTNGTVNLLDDEDAHTLVVALPEFRFEKTVVNVTSGADPASTAAPGDTLRYRLRIENLGDSPLNDFRIFDELGRLNQPAVYQPGTLVLVSVPANADTRNTSATAGANGSGMLDVRNLNLPRTNDSLSIEFEITLAPVLANGALVTNQSQWFLGDALIAVSDDPNVNGQASAFVAGDEDPTRVAIVSAPAFRVEKVSAYVSGDPSVLFAGETLRYTITVNNVGNDDAEDVILRDAVPVNTQYVGGSTTLNGVAVAGTGISPLANGIPIHAPGDPTSGVLRADASSPQTNTATIVFDVVVDPGVIDGTVISNQAFVSALEDGVIDRPSDDPRTPIVDDPTRDVVGASPLLFAPKGVVLGADAGTQGIVDPGDVLHYTIRVFNTGNVAATGAVITDSVPANTTYVANTTTLNGTSVGRPDNGVSPLAAGIPVHSSDLTAASAGALNPGESALLEFDLRVNAGVPGGTVISNQAVVRTDQLSDLLTDGDGNPATGPEPTQVVVGDGQQLSITKQVAVVGGGAAQPGSVLEYVLRVVNIAAVPAFSVSISDDLDASSGRRLSYVDQSATLNGSPTGIRVLGSEITADYSAIHGALGPGGEISLRFRAVIDANLALGTTVTNTGVVTWNTPPQSASASVSLDVGGMPGVGIVSGGLWHDADFDDTFGPGETALSGWTIEFYRNGRRVSAVTSDTTGTYRIGGLEPNDANGDAYELRFAGPGVGSSTASLGRADSAFTNGPQRISDIAVGSGSNLQNLNLPIDPNGVVYDAISRQPIAGATLTLLSANGDVPVPTRCFDDSAQQGQVTGSAGYYKFDLNDSDGSCASSGYRIEVEAPPAGFTVGVSEIIPPVSDITNVPLHVPSCPGTADDALIATTDFCEAQPSEFAPPTSVAARSSGTRYHLLLEFDASQLPGSGQIFNNHIPLDPVLDGAIAISKTASSLLVSRGELVPYEITLRNALGTNLPDVSIVDRFPPGFRYVEGSARIDGKPAEPTVQGQELRWTGLSVGAIDRLRIVVLLVVGAGVNEGEFVNRVSAISTLTGAALSGEATATVRVVPDPTFDCTDVMGKVFDDVDRDGVQDRGDRGIAGVRVVTARGLAATTDPHGRFHITCAVTPHEARGSNFVLKLDDRTLPSGYRMSTRQSQVRRATAGKALRFSFGASLHRVVGLDLADAVFEPGKVKLRAQWRSRFELLLEQLEKTPSILRLSYVADIEDEALVERRLAAIQGEIEQAWESRDVGYRLTIEPAVFWQRGGPMPGNPIAHTTGDER